MNLASGDATIVEKSYATVLFALKRAEKVGAQGVVVHAGSHRDLSRSDGVRQVAKHARSLLKQTSEVHLVFELTAGGGAPIASRPEDARDLAAATEELSRVQFCIDTQHLFAAGFPWHEAGGVDALMAALDHDVGLKRIDCIHVNDSKAPFGSRHDRHEVIGKGLIGLAPFEQLLSRQELSGIPLILETPGELEDHADEVRLIRKLAST